MPPVRGQIGVFVDEMFYVECLAMSLASATNEQTREKLRRLGYDMNIGAGDSNFWLRFANSNPSLAATSSPATRQD